MCKHNYWPGSAIGTKPPSPCPSPVRREREQPDLSFAVSKAVESGLKLRSMTRFPLNCSRNRLAASAVFAYEQHLTKAPMRTTRCFSFTANRCQESAGGFSFADLLTVLGVTALLVLLQMDLTTRTGKSCREKSLRPPEQAPGLTAKHKRRRRHAFTV